MIQRGKQAFLDAKGSNDKNTAPADTITGFLLRSSAVSGWPHMDVRAYKTESCRSPSIPRTIIKTTHNSKRCVSNCCRRA